MSSDDIEIAAGGLVARIVHKSDDGCKVHFDQRHGGSGTITSGAPLALNVGDRVLLWPEDNRAEVAPLDLWPDDAPTLKEDAVAVVRLRLKDRTVVDEGGKWRLVPTPSSPDYREGNTVTVSAAGTITEVLSNNPLRLIDLATGSEIDVTRFKVDPNTISETFEDFGGMDHVVTRARKLIELPLTKSEQLAKIGARPIKGVLFSGPPGTGKTMLARIIARHANAAFYKVSGPEILTKWYGESEAVLRSIFENAEKQARSIIFFDEIDTVAASRSDNTHEVSKKLVGQLLTLMDGFSSDEKVVVVAATNRPETLDPALRRPGRFDWEVEFTLPGQKERHTILERSTRGLSVNSGLPHGEISEMTEGWSPAELVVIWSEAALLAADDGRESIHEEDYREGYRRVAQQRQQRGVADA